MKVFVCALGIALVLGFAGIAGAQQEDVIDDETPYIDAEGNFDADMAKEYAELVDSYVDADGVAWEVWLDELGGQMWAETAGEVGTDEIIYHMFVPDFVYVYRSGAACYFTLDGSMDGYIAYDSEISCPGFDHCYKWLAFGVDDAPTDAIEIYGKGKSNNDYCDGYYDGYYAVPDGNWADPDISNTCTGTGPSYYYVRADAGFNGTADYDAGDRMVRWDYRIGALDYSTRVYYGGMDPR